MRRLVLRLLLAALLFGVAGPACSGDEGDQQVEGRSGFWTSRRPAKGGAYRWRLLGIGVVLVVITGYGTLRLIRRANAERQNRLR